MNVLLIKENNYKSSFTAVKNTLERNMPGVKDDEFLSSLAGEVVANVYVEEEMAIRETEAKRLQEMARFLNEQGLNAFVDKEYNIQVKSGSKKEIQDALQQFHKQFE